MVKWHAYYGLSAAALAGQLVEYTKWFQWFRYGTLGLSITSYVEMVNP